MPRAEKLHGMCRITDILTTTNFIGYYENFIINDILILISCATKPKHGCNNVNWVEAGMIDGTEGVENITASDFAKVCGVLNDLTIVEQYNIGLSAINYRICSKMVAKTKGSVGMSFNYSACPKPVRNLLWGAYRDGVQENINRIGRKHKSTFSH